MLEKTRTAMTSFAAAAGLTRNAPEVDATLNGENARLLAPLLIINSVTAAGKLAGIASSGRTAPQAARTACIYGLTIAVTAAFCATGLKRKDFFKRASRGAEAAIWAAIATQLTYGFQMATDHRSRAAGMVAFCITAVWSFVIPAVRPWVGVALVVASSAMVAVAGEGQAGGAEAPAAALVASLAIACLMRYASARKSAMARAEAKRLSETDPLTGLGNREALKAALESISGKKATVCMVDIDGFKKTNDEGGHEAGDEKLREFADALEKTFGRGRAFRFGGDEFIAVMEGSGRKEVYRKIGELRKRLGTEFPFTAGAVFGECPKDGGRAMASQADDALIRTKRTSKGATGFETFDPLRKKERTEKGEKENRDGLTGLLTKDAFVARAERDASAESGGAEGVAIAYVNVKRFRELNETSGFENGNEALVRVAEAIGQALPGRAASRFSDDRFAALCDVEEADELAARLFEKSKAGEIPETAVGASVISDAVGPLEACDRAKVACAAENAGNGKTSWFDETMERALKARRAVEIGVRLGSPEGYGVSVHYQPIVNATTGERMGYEALCRWNDKELGRLLPNEFVEALEEDGMIGLLDEAVYRTVLSDMARGALPDRAEASVNFSRRDFADPELPDRLARMAAEAGVEPGRIAIEVTESAMALDEKALARSVSKLKELGFTVWLDDFGTGYSALAALEGFDFDVVKLDMGIVRNMENGEKGEKYVAAIVGMLKGLDKTVLAEGVETSGQVEKLRRTGCDLMQGFLYGRPEPLDERNESA